VKQITYAIHAAIFALAALVFWMMLTWHRG
jgi:hypothetical protein